MRIYEFLGVRLIKEREYERALETFGYINSLFSLGAFNPEEEELIRTVTFLSNINQTSPK